MASEAGTATLGGIPFQVNPYDVNWDCSLKVIRKRTVGGFVVQIIGVHVGDITVSGVFAYGDTPGDSAGWQEQERFRAQIRTWADNAAQDINNTIEFNFPAYNWSFQVYVKEFTSNSDEAIRLSNTILAPVWTVKLFIVQDRTKVVVKGIKDLYVQRLFNGVGWRQTNYNGPLTVEAANAYVRANGKDLIDFTKKQFSAVAQGKAPVVPTATPIPTGQGSGVADAGNK